MEECIKHYSLVPKTLSKIDVCNDEVCKKLTNEENGQQLISK